MTTLELAPVWRAGAHQRMFRHLLDAVARPGLRADLRADLGEAAAWLGVLAVFCDNTQTLADLTGALSDADRRFLGVADAPATTARFILADGARPPGDLEPVRGTLEQPDLGTTLVIRVARLGAGDPLRLSGPGVPGERDLAVTGLNSDWLDARARWCADFPLGCDLVLADATGAVVLPRTTRITKG